jgi:hypothetical protein
MIVNRRMSRVVSVHSSIMRFRYFWRPECGAWKDRDCTGLSLSGRDSGNYTSTTHGDYDGKHHAGTVDDRVRQQDQELGTGPSHFHGNLQSVSRRRYSRFSGWFSAVRRARTVRARSAVAVEYQESQRERYLKKSNNFER